MRRPRLRLASGDSGGHGAPVGRHYDRSARSSLDWDWLTQSPKGGGLVPGSPVRGQKSPRWSAGRRALSQESACRKAASKTKRCPALRPLRFWPKGKEEDRLPRAAKNRGDDACLISNDDKSQPSW